MKPSFFDPNVIPDRQAYYTPADFGLNAVAMPIAPGVNSSVIDISGYSLMSLYFLVTQPGNISIQVFAPDSDNTPVLGPLYLLGSFAAAAVYQVINYGKKDSDVNVIGVGTYPLVMKRVLFNFASTGVAGVVTAWLFLRPGGS